LTLSSQNNIFVEIFIIFEFSNSSGKPITIDSPLESPSTATTWCGIVLVGDSLLLLLLFWPPPEASVTSALDVHME
jgi:hypothetical protein